MNEPLITLALTIATLSSNPSDPATKNDALRAIGRGTFINYGIDKKLKRYEKKYFPQELKQYGAYIALCYTVTVERQVKIQWTF
jgi:hypothetical protein